MLNLIANPRNLLFAISAGFSFWLGWHICGVYAKAHEKQVLASQAEQLTLQCETDKKTTMEANNALRDKISNINERLISLKRVQPSKCVAIAPELADNTAGGEREYARQNGKGINSDWLRDFAAECEVYRTEVILLDDFGKKNFK